MAKRRKRYSRGTAEEVEREMHRYKRGTAHSGRAGKAGRVKSRAGHCDRSFEGQAEGQEGSSEAPLMTDGSSLRPPPTDQAAH